MWNRFMLPVIHYDAYRIGFLKACMNYYTYDLERTIERKEKDCANEDEKEIDEFARALYRRIHT